jgi:hypothetical protein
MVTGKREVDAADEEDDEEAAAAARVTMIPVTVNEY